MRSLVSDLIPEYNKKLQFFLKRHWFMLWDPPPPFSYHQLMCAINIYLYGKLVLLSCMETNTEHSL